MRLDQLKTVAHVDRGDRCEKFVTLERLILVGDAEVLAIFAEAQSALINRTMADEGSEWDILRFKESETYLNSVEDNGDNVACFDRLTVARSFVVTAMTEFSIIESPSVLGVTERHL